MRRYGARSAVGVVVTGLVLLLAGFSGWHLLKPAATSSEPAIVVGTTNAAATLDPAGGYDAGSWALYSNLYQSLLTLVPGNDQPVPDAAKRCAFTNDQLTVYSCELREALKFSNGREVTGKDVVHSFERIRKIGDPRSPASLLENLKSVRAHGQTVIFTLKTPDAVFPFKIAGGAGAILDRKHYPEDELLTGDEAVGSGPFVLEEYEAGTSVRLAPNPDYQGAMPSATDTIHVRYFSSANALSAAWKNGQLDVNDGHIPPSDLTSLADGRDVLVENDGIDIRVLAFNTRKGSAMAQAAARQAVAATVNRDPLATRTHLGTVDPLYSLIPDGLSGHATPYLDAYPEPSVEVAAELLATAGLSTPVHFEIAYSKGPAARQEAEMLAEQLDGTGLFRVTATHYTWDAFLEGLSEGAFDAYTLGWSPDYPDPETYTAPLVGTDGPMLTGYSDRRLDTLIERTRRHENRGGIGAEFQEIQRLAVEDAPVLPLWQSKDYVISSPRVYGAEFLRDFNGSWALWQLSWA